MSDIENIKYRLLGSFLDFTRFFYKERTGRKFELSDPKGRESHFLTIAKALTQISRGEIKRLIINIPPRYGKTELLIHFIAWMLARYPDSNFIYVSYSKTLASKQTSTIKQIVQIPYFKQFFGVDLSDNTHAKDNFETSINGSVYAVGADGTITGRGAGIKNVERFGGAIVIDDILKPNEASSDVMRESINNWYFNTLLSRRNNGDKTPIIFIGQRLHEDDLAARLIAGSDGHKWHEIILPSVDENNHALYPEFQSLDELKTLEEVSPYEFAAQYQQNPQPAGGALFKRDWFKIHDQIPNIIATFITCDTAETSKTYNDATVFSFWGLYDMEYEGVNIGKSGLVWLDCHEIWVEPKDLKSEFLAFYSSCMRFQVKPQSAYIEKKSTGTTLVSILKEMPGLNILEIERSRDSGSKTSRFLNVQPYIATHCISFISEEKHVKKCINHMIKITANNSHRYDDIADTCADAIKIALIEHSLLGVRKKSSNNLDSFSKMYKTLGK